MGMAKNFLKALPGAAVETLVGTPVKFGTSAAASVVDIPRQLVGKEPMSGTVKFPGLDFEY